MAATKRSKKQKQEAKDRVGFLVLFDSQRSEPDDEEVPDETDPKVGRDKRGRPTVMTKQALRKLKDAFKFGCTDEEACFYAGVGTRTFYEYCEKDEDFAQEKEELKQTPILAARRNIVTGIFDGDSGQSWEYLRAKRKKEFAPQINQDVALNPLTEADIEEGEAAAFNIPPEPEKPKTHVFNTKPKVAQ